MKKSLLMLASLFVAILANAQDSASAAPATGLRADGKIYVVIVILVTILLGLFIYVARMDRKISRLEKQA